jgi:hypothetical protein
MKRPILLCILAVVALSAAHGCIFSPKTDPPPPPPTNYKEQTSPENVLWNLQVAYRRYRTDIAEYAKLLHPEFLFYFQPNDARDLGQDYWNRDVDSTQTGALFDAQAVTRIDINLTYGSAAPVSPGSDTLKIRVNPTFLEVDELDEDQGVTITWRVSGDIQDMFFVQSDRDPSIWEIVEWRDIDGGGGSTGLLETAAQDSPADPRRQIRNVSWGALREHLAQGGLREP